VSLKPGFLAGFAGVKIGLMKLKKITIFMFLIVVALLASACTASISGGFPSGTVSQDVLYLSGGTGVVAIKPDGSEVWRYPDKVDAAKSFYAVPAVVDGQVIIGDYQNTLFSLDAANGAEKWNFAEAKGRYIASPIVVGDKIVAPNGEGFIYGLDLTGKLVWKFTGKAGFWSAAQANKDNTVVYVASMDHTLYAINVSDGSQVWAVDVGSPMLTTPALADDGVLYVSTIGSQVIAVNSTTGDVIWKFDANGAIWSTPYLKDGVLYFGDISNKVFAVNAKDGSLAWSGDAPGPVYATPAAIPSGLVYVCETGDIFVVGFDGVRSWTDKVSNGKLYSTPVVFGERVIIPVDKGDSLLVTYDFTGRKGWTFAPIK
jgi:outer membrane protein assembly factor BamB